MADARPGKHATPPPDDEARVHPTIRIRVVGHVRPDEVRVRPPP